MLRKRIAVHHVSQPVFCLHDHRIAETDFHKQRPPAFLLTENNEIADVGIFPGAFVANGKIEIFPVNAVNADRMTVIFFRMSVNFHRRPAAFPHQLIQFFVFRVHPEQQFLRRKLHLVGKEGQSLRKGLILKLIGKNGIDIGKIRTPFRLKIVRQHVFNVARTNRVLSNHQSAGGKFARINIIFFQRRNRRADKNHAFILFGSNRQRRRFPVSGRPIMPQKGRHQSPPARVQLLPIFKRRPHLPFLFLTQSKISSPGYSPCPNGVRSKCPYRFSTVSSFFSSTSDAVSLKK